MHQQYMKKDQKDKSTVVYGLGLMNSTSFGEFTTGKLIISDVFLVTQPVLVTQGYIIFDEMSILVIVLC
jgi:hypothetical protein